MCKSDFCPCSPEISASKYGSRSPELKDLDISSGLASQFFEDCYQPLVSDGRLKSLSSDFLALLKQFESEKDCQGMCNTSLFYFFKSSKDGPPP